MMQLFTGRVWLVKSEGPMTFRYSDQDIASLVREHKPLLTDFQR